MLPRLTSMLAVWVVLVLWQSSAGHAGDLTALACLLLLALPIGMSGVEWAFCRRDAFCRAYLAGGGWLERVMGVVPLVLIGEAAKALVLALVLMMSAVSLDLRGWSVLLLNMLILSLLMPRLPALLAESVKRTYLFALARRWAIWVSTLLLWAESTVALVLSGGDDYRGLSLRAALEYSMPDGRFTADGLLDGLARIDAASGALGAWAMAVLGDNSSPDQQMAAWLVLTLVLLLMLLAALAYSRALIGTLARPLAIWRPRPERHAAQDPLDAWWL